MGIVLAGFLAIHISFAPVANVRTLAAIRVGLIGVATPLLSFTGALSKADVRSILDAFKREATVN
jgi:hypothetical protein